MDKERKEFLAIMVFVIIPFILGFVFHFCELWFSIPTFIILGILWTGAWITIKDS